MWGRVCVYMFSSLKRMYGHELLVDVDIEKKNQKVQHVYIHTSISLSDCRSYIICKMDM